MSAIATDYPLFNWQSSNGSATAELTQTAYEVATTQGLCINFSRLVWNDIVDTLYELLVALDMDWDETYTTRSDATISEAKGMLTSVMFNSVRHNIEHAAFTTWKWQFDYLRDGYVGRKDFRGATQVGSDKADRVFGWYIIELVRKLNVTY